MDRALRREVEHGHTADCAIWTLASGPSRPAWMVNVTMTGWGNVCLTCCSPDLPDLPLHAGHVVVAACRGRCRRRTRRQQLEADRRVRGARAAAAGRPRAAVPAPVAGGRGAGARRLGLRARLRRRLLDVGLRQALAAPSAAAASRSAAAAPAPPRAPASGAATSGGGAGAGGAGFGLPPPPGGSCTAKPSTILISGSFGARKAARNAPPTSTTCTSPDTSKPPEKPWSSASRCLDHRVDRVAHHAGPPSPAAARRRNRSARRPPSSCLSTTSMTRPYRSALVRPQVDHLRRAALHDAHGCGPRAGRRSRPCRR